MKLGETSSSLSCQGNDAWFPTSFSHEGFPKSNKSARFLNFFLVGFNWLFPLSLAYIFIECVICSTFETSPSLSKMSEMCLLVQNHWGCVGGNGDKHSQHNLFRSHLLRKLSWNIIKLHLAFTLHWFVRPNSAVPCSLWLQPQSASITPCSAWAVKDGMWTWKEPCTS